MRRQAQIQQREASGFTIIELLVVVAIISLLSSVVLVSLSSSRLKARNAERVAQVGEYIKAFEQFQINARSYPGGAIAQSRYCLGDRPQGTCYGGLYSENSQLNSEIERFIKPPPSGNDVGVPYTGYVYSCTQQSGSFCNGFDLIWFLEGENQTCSPGFRVSGSQNGGTFCQYVQCGIRKQPTLSGGLYQCL
ncbi:MAG TPA: type II secretion system protein [Candidatus Paceibacterota bacterium]